ncbi:hypothetical protein DXG80_00575 [Deinococcus radiodurans]|nr:hypothetical protein DXG80_00575 [Deinococcus radiodurans]
MRAEGRPGRVIGANCRERGRGLSTAYTDCAPFQHSRKSTACASIPRNPYFFLLASALLRSFTSRIESKTTGFNRKP